MRMVRMSMVRERVYSAKKLAEILLAKLPIGNVCPRMKYIRRKQYLFVHFGACSETCREAQHRVRQKVIREQKKKG